MIKAFGQHRQLNWSTSQRLNGLIRHLRAFQASPFTSHIHQLGGEGLTLFTLNNQKATISLSRYSSDYLDCDQEGELEMRWIVGEDPVWIMSFFFDLSPETGQPEIHLTRNQGTSKSLQCLRLVRKELNNLDFFRVAFSALKGVARACGVNRIIVVTPNNQCTIGHLPVLDPLHYLAASRQYRDVFEIAGFVECLPKSASTAVLIDSPLDASKGKERHSKWRARHRRALTLLAEIEQQAFSEVQA